MFEFLFKYPGAVFQKGQFVLLAPWPVWMLALGVIAAGGAAALARAAQPRAADRCAPAGDLAAGNRHDRAAAVPAVASGHQHRHAAAAAERGRRAGGRFAQHGHPGRRRTRAARRPPRCSTGKLLAELGQKFQVRLYRFGKEAERIQKTSQLTAAAAGHAHRRQPEAGAGGIVHAAAGRGGAAERWRGQLRRHRSGDHLADPAPAHSGAHHRLRPREAGTRMSRSPMPCCPARALADSRLSALVTFRQYGYAGQKALAIGARRRQGAGLARSAVEGRRRAANRNAAVQRRRGRAARRWRFPSIRCPAKRTATTTRCARLVNVETRKPRILYIEGEPRWEFKFIRRAAEDDRSLQLVSMLRTTQNKIYRAGLRPIRTSWRRASRPRPKSCSPSTG